MCALVSGVAVYTSVVGESVHVAIGAGVHVRVRVVPAEWRRQEQSRHFQRHITDRPDPLQRNARGTSCTIQCNSSTRQVSISPSFGKWCHFIYKLTPPTSTIQYNTIVVQDKSVFRLWK